jgi:adenosine/AMP kinase
MKSTHLPVKLPSQDICKEPGDVIAADVVGPYKVAIDGSQFFLTVQDLASGLVSAIPMKTKGEATKELIRWLGQFVNLSKWAIR